MKIEVKVNKTAQTFSTEWDKLPEATRTYLAEYGLRQVLNDCHSAEKDREEAAKLVSAKFADLEAGVIRKGGGGARLDPVEAEARAIVIAALVKKGYSKTDATKAAPDTLAKQSDEVRESIMEKARANVEARKGVDIEI
jgi:hypothetical protein